MQKTDEGAQLMEKIVSLCKRRGFIFQSSEIYGGLASAWDYGPLGVELKRNVKEAWWKAVVHARDDIVGLDASILMHPRTWEASGHTSSFSDPFIKCPSCKKYFRLDKIWDDIWESPWCTSLRKGMTGGKDGSYFLRWAKKEGQKLAPHLPFVQEPEKTLARMTDLKNTFTEVNMDFKNFIGRLAAQPSGVAQTPCPHCGAALPEEGVPANLMLKTSLGPVEETAENVFLRPETAQGIFVNFQNVIDSTSRKLPFGIAQIGKAFRNEVTAKNFIFRTREFEQMEIEYFTQPDNADECYAQWIKDRLDWYLDLGIRKEHLRVRPHEKNELAHYAKGCSDIEYNFPFGWSELEGIANRTDFDLKQHSQYSGKDLQYQDQVTNAKFFPYVIEPSGGVDRATLAFLVDAYHEEEVEGKTRVVLKLSKPLAPIKVAVLPLLKNNHEIVTLAKNIKKDLQKHFTCMYNDTAAIGRLYRRQDEVGTFYCVTVDVQSLEDKQVTVRERDTMAQKRIPLENLKAYLIEKLTTST
jgi:glycyl-tRNA synthetase